MTRIYYSYRNWTDAQGNNYSLSYQTKNYPELFFPIQEWLPPVAGMSENFIAQEKYRWGDRLWYVDINDEILAMLPIDVEYIKWTLERIGSILNLDIIEDIDVWMKRYTKLEKTEEWYKIWEVLWMWPIFLK